MTLRSIANRIDVAPALVAHYQPNMDVLIASTFARSSRSSSTRCAACSDRETPIDRMAALLETLLDGTRDDVTVVWVEAWAMGRRNEPLAGAVREQMDAWQAVVQQVVEDGRTSGEFDADDAADVA